MKNYFKLYLVLLIIFYGCTTVKNNISYDSNQNYDEKLGIDTNVKIGKLENGLTYYIRKNSKPENRADLRLVVNAGSVLETDEQQGIAHLVEHMAFNGTEHFKAGELASFFQLLGMELGHDINAFTTFMNTFLFQNMRF